MMTSLRSCVPTSSTPCRQMSATLSAHLLCALPPQGRSPNGRQHAAANSRAHAVLTEDARHKLQHARCGSKHARAKCLQEPSAQHACNCWDNRQQAELRGCQQLHAHRGVGQAARPRALTLHTMSPAAWSSTKSRPLQSGQMRSCLIWAPSA